MKVSYFIILITILSCNTQKNKYKNIYHFDEKSLLGSVDYDRIDSSEIKEYESDSAAYYWGCIGFEISKKVHKEMKLNYRNYTYVDVLNSNRENIKYKLNDTLVKKLERLAFEEISKENLTGKTTENEVELNLNTNLSEPEINALKSNFRIKKDEFDKDATIWYIPKSAPSFVNENAFYCYFGITDGKVTPLHLISQYYADDWLFIKEYKFSIDDKSYSYIPYRIKTDNGDGGMIWEWSDEIADNNINNILKAIINSKNAKIKFEGKDYYKIKNITSAQIKSIKETIQLFISLGGKI